MPPYEPAIDKASVSTPWAITSTVGWPCLQPPLASRRAHSCTRKAPPARSPRRGPPGSLPILPSSGQTHQILVLLEGDNRPRTCSAPRSFVGTNPGRALRCVLRLVQPTGRPLQCRVHRPPRPRNWATVARPITCTHIARRGEDSVQEPVKPVRAPKTNRHESWLAPSVCWFWVLASRLPVKRQF